MKTALCTFVIAILGLGMTKTMAEEVKFELIPVPKNCIVTIDVPNELDSKIQVPGQISQPSSNDDKRSIDLKKIDPNICKVDPRNIKPDTTR